MKFALALAIIVSGLLAHADQTIANPIFFKAEKNGHVAYILGTVHFRVKPAELPSPVWKALEQSSVIMVEKNTVAEVQQKQSQPQVPADKRLGALLPEKEFRFLYSLVQQNWGDMIPISQLAAMDIVSGVYLSQIGPQDVMAQVQDDTIDQQVALRAMKANKPVIELDAGRDDTTVISVDDLKKQIDDQIAKGAATAAAETNADIQKTVDDYRAGVCSDDIKKDFGADTEKTLVIDRNRKWMTTITQALDKSTSPIFIATGCAHWSEEDPNSVFNEMKAAGYMLTRMKAK